LSELDGTQETVLEQPTNDNEETWKKYWSSQGQSWRTEPEISKERQEFLAERRKIEPNYEQRIYPFKDIKLNRADIEWLLSTHDNNRGPVDWNDESQREREGLDLKGADLRGLNLSGLPLASCHLIEVHLEDTDLSDAHLTNADLSDAHLENASLFNAHLEKASLVQAHLEGALLDIAHLENAYLDKAHLEKASLVQAHLEKASLRTAHLEGALLDSVHLEGANLEKAKLVGAYLKEAHLEGANLEKAKLARAYLKAAFFDSATKLDEISLNNNEYDTAFLCDIHWGDVNVAVVDWSTISILGEENEAREDKSRVRYERAVRAYRQLSVVLRNQGLSEHAARFAFRAQRMQRKVF